MRRKLAKPAWNMMSLIGVTLALVMLGLIVLLYVLELFARQKHPYMGLVTFIVLPTFMFVGIGMALLGYIRSRRRVESDTSPPLPVVDLGNPRHRRNALLASVGMVLFLVVSAFGSYQAYEYTEQVSFCGQTCHKVMQPEFVAYQNSPHARVSCVECHIGEGATWFVRSKVSGTYQVYSTAMNKYPRPIETPIHNLRLAKETCEQCHWPSHFYSAKLRSFTYFGQDEKNSPTRLDMLMKIGGGDPEHGGQRGIHAHMYIDRKISYVATDKRREVIPYVVSETPDGKKTVYRSTETEITDAQIKGGEHRRVDCIDCHNRPTHIFRHPSRSVNLAMDAGLISRDLPEIKRVAVESLDAEYKTRAEANQGISKAIRDFYAESYPEVATRRKADVDQAVTQVLEIHRRNYFPEMKTSWKAFPDQIGHMHNDGCFRCHDGKHVSEQGKVISNDCNSCHTLMAEGTGGEVTNASLKGVEFRHPGEMGDMWKGSKCSTCHAPQPAE